jgi:hypothetical protein
LEKIVEIKALDRLIDAHRAQTLNYLNATKYDLALLVNFGHFPKIEYERIANDRNRAAHVSIYQRMADRENEGI